MDNAVASWDYGIYDFLASHFNPNGCPTEATLYLTHPFANYCLVHEQYHRVYEIAVQFDHVSVLDHEDISVQLMATKCNRHWTDPYFRLNVDYNHLCEEMMGMRNVFQM